VNYLIPCDGVRDYLCDDFEAREVFLHLKSDVSHTNTALMLGASVSFT
jgi:hypothetical protein